MICLPRSMYYYYYCNRIEIYTTYLGCMNASLLFHILFISIPFKWYVSIRETRCQSRLSFFYMRERSLAVRKHPMPCHLAAQQNPSLQKLANSKRYIIHTYNANIEQPAHLMRVNLGGWYKVSLDAHRRLFSVGRWAMNRETKNNICHLSARVKAPVCEMS